jgi:alpha-tubulin suppressor-like RCC1 family protein
MEGLTSVESVTTDERHSCALRTDGTVRCWGSNRAGEFGDGQTGIQTYITKPTAVSGLSNAVSLSTGVDHTCAVLSDGSGACWGANDRGQLGNATQSPSLTPTAVSGLNNAVSVAAGDQFTCALIDDGHVSCWGANDRGQLGIGSVIDSTTPTTVDGIGDATAIAVGSWTACAIRVSGSVSCWGDAGTFGVLGDGTTVGSGVYSADPVAVSGLTGATSVAIFNRTDPDSGSACASRSDGTVWCWGEHYLGDGTASDSPVPVQVLGIDDAVAVSAGSAPCALRSDGTVQCWGDDLAYGLLGDGHRMPSLTPVDVDHVGNFDALPATAISTSTDTYETCVVTTDQTVTCWGIIKSPGQPA